MLNRFLHLYLVIQNSINISKNISNKNQLSLFIEEIQYLNDCLDIFKIFIKATTKLQANKYSIIQYIYSYIYQIRTRLNEKFNQESLVSNIIYMLFDILIYLIAFCIEKCLSIRHN
jgi:hypothetical protein